MKAILRQEWQGRKKIIGIWSLIQGVVAVLSIALCLIAPHVSLQMEAVAEIWTGIVFCFFFLGLPLYTLLRGAGSLEYWTKDGGYLDLLLPVSPYKLIGGKMIIGLAEFFVYFIPACLYSSVLVPAVSLLDPDNVSGFAEMVPSLYRVVFVDQLSFSVNLVFAIVVIFLVAQAVFNCAVVLYLSFIKWKRGATLEIFILILIACYIMIKATAFTAEISGFNYEVLDSWKNFWRVSLVSGVFGVLYYLLTCFLIRHKVEV